MEISRDFVVENNASDYRFYKNRMLSPKKYKARVRKDFVKLVKKLMVGLCVATLSIVALKYVFTMNTAVSTGIFLSIGSVAFVMSYKIIKHVYILLVAALYLFLLSAMLYN